MIAKSAFFEIRRITEADLDRLVDFFDRLLASGLEKIFHPHPFDVNAAHQICNHKGQDWYAGGFLLGNSQQMVGYVMLRGWDAGFAIPSFGVCVLPEFQGAGLGKILLDVAVLTARLRDSPSIRLKVYPENKRAIDLYKKADFKFLKDLEDGQMVGYLSLG